MHCLLLSPMRRDLTRRCAFTAVSFPSPPPSLFNPFPSRTASERRLVNLRVSRRPRERDHVADVAQAGQKQERSLQPQPEPGVWHRAVAAQVEVPPVRVRVELLLAHALGEHVEPLLA